VRSICAGNATLCGIFLSVMMSNVAVAASGRMAIQSQADLGGKCIDVPYAKFFRGMRLQMWSCNSVITWGKPNVEVTLGIKRKNETSDIRVRLGETAVEGPIAQVFDYDDKNQQFGIGGLCVRSWGRGDPQDAVGLGGCGGRANLQWRMVESGKQFQIVGTNGLCLEVRSGIKENGAPLDLAACDASRAQQLWTLKPPTRGVLGVQWRKPTDQEASSLGLAPGTGVIVTKVLQGGPSEKSGLVEGDAIATIDGEVINGPAIAPASAKSPSGTPGCSRYMPSVGLTVSVPCDEYLADESEAKRTAEAPKERKPPSATSSAQVRWAALNPNNESSSSIAWAASQDEARRLAVDACKHVSQTCAAAAADTKEMADMFAVVCCAQPALSCGAGVANSRQAALAAVTKRFSDAGYTQCTLKNYINAGTGEKE
jgi:hypothetical protein